MNSSSENEAEKPKETEPEVVQDAAAPSHKTPTTTPEPESRFRGFLRSITRWVLVALISFIAGIILLYVLVHQPVLAELDQAKTDIGNLEAQVERLAPLEGENRALQTQADEAILHTTIVSIQNDVLEARLALEAEDASAAHVALGKTAQNLNNLKSLLPTTYGGQVEDMISRYKLVLSEIDRDRAAALQDLEILATQLLTLENALYTNP